MRSPAQTFGAWGESIAENFLHQKGYTIVDRNYRMKRGELDLVAWHKKLVFGKTICFIEVKSRRGERGSAERATGRDKQARMQRAAMHWCLENRIPTDRTPIQFEQVSVYDTGAEPEIFHYVLPAY